MVSHCCSLTTSVSSVLQTVFAGTVDDQLIAYTPDYGCMLAKVWNPPITVGTE